ncbi:MAG: CARDB domain-containing protein [Candidatus Eisenbacteria bacterium]
MHRPSILHLGLAALMSFAAAVCAARADTIVLDSDDCSDWVRVFSSATWKQKDACLHPAALLKFDIPAFHDPSQIVDARLHLFVEAARGECAFEIWHVLDDGWSYAGNEPLELWNWPVSDLVSAHVFADTASFSVDVTEHLREEALLGSTQFSVKFVGLDYPAIRIASPRAPLERMRPRIVLEYVADPAPPPQPDLAVSGADIHLTPMRATPGQAVTLQARIRNIGAGEALNVPVALYEGDPASGNPPIGVWIIAYLPPQAAEEVAVPWTASRGMREIWVVADFEEVVFESDEANNAAVRTFSIVDTGEYEQLRESFEWPGGFTWHADFDVPKQFEYPGPKSFYVNHSCGEAYHGEGAMELYLDGTADDGTIWVETAVAVERYRHVEVTVDFELFRYYPDIAFIPVAAVTLFDPETEADFRYLDGEAAAGWSLHSHQAVLYTGPYDVVHIAVGLTCTWETPGTFFLDLVRAQVREIPAAVEGAGGTASRTALFQSRPNPLAGPLASIAYELTQPGPVSLRIFDAAGRRVVTLRDGEDAAGAHRVRWDGTDDAGRAVPTGVYFYTLRTREGEESRKLLLAR